MTHQTVFHQYNLKTQQHRYELLWKSLNDARFSFTYKSVPDAAKPYVGDGPHYKKANIYYVKVLLSRHRKTLVVQRKNNIYRLSIHKY